MRRSVSAAGAAVALFLHSAPGPAQVSVPASMGKDILQNVVFGSVKNQLIGSLAGMGCKGPSIAGLAASARAGGAGAAVPTLDPAAMQKAMEMVQQQVAQGRMSQEQAAMAQKMITQMQGASQPLSREETLAVFDDLAGLGILSDSMRSEAKDCIALAAPGSGDSIGAAAATMKNVVMPAARQGKERMANLSPEEQKQLADGMVDALNSASDADRKAFFDGLGIGFFPAPVVEQVRGRVKP